MFVPGPGEDPAALGAPIRRRTGRSPCDEERRAERRRKPPKLGTLYGISGTQFDARADGMKLLISSWMSPPAPGAKSTGQVPPTLQDATQLLPEASRHDTARRDARNASAVSQRVGPRSVIFVGAAGANDATGSSEARRFEALMLPHMDAVYNFVRWLSRSDEAAADIVQETYASAFAGFHGFAGENSKGWIMTIARHACYAWFRRERGARSAVSYNEETHGADDAESLARPGSSPEAVHSAAQDRARLRRAIATLPDDYREVIVLRDLEGMSYKEIAKVLDVPVGTVMSRLSRGRGRLLDSLGEGGVR